MELFQRKLLILSLAVALVTVALIEALNDDDESVVGKVMRKGGEYWKKLAEEIKKKGQKATGIMLESARRRRKLVQMAYQRVKQEPIDLDEEVKQVLEGLEKEK